MKTNIIKSVLVSFIFIVLIINCQKDYVFLATYIYGEAGLTDFCSIDNNGDTYYPVYSFQINPDSIGIRDFKNCRLSLNKKKEYIISYHFVLYTYNDTILFEWEDSGKYFIDVDGYHFESTVGQSWESSSYLRAETKTLILREVPNEKKWRLLLEWDFSDGEFEQVKVY